jgi:hypothetical protein
MWAATMISPVNGEVSFDDGLIIQAHATLSALVLSQTGFLFSSLKRRDLKVPGWSQYELGVHASCHGEFQVEASVSDVTRVEAVFLSHCHAFYEADTPLDGERRIYHEGVIAIDLCGQREFQWGHAFCRYQKEGHRDWLVVVYSPFANVAMREHAVERLLHAHEPLPAEERKRGSVRNL